MLDRDSLSQLHALKQQLHEAVDRAEGVIKGTQGRFGFVLLDDGREVFLPPEQMLRVFPDDRVAVRVVPAPAAQPTSGDERTGKGNRSAARPEGDKKSGKSGTGNKKSAGKKGGSKKERPHAELERLVDSPLQEFTGRYAIKGNAHFVIPDLPRLSRWLFLAPNARADAQPGDFVVARIRRHPFRDGKPQAEIVRRIGAAGAPLIESDYAAAHWQLPSTPAPLVSAIPVVDGAGREDLTGLPLITIDSADTEDMDDALYAEPTGTGWRIWIAIADPLPLLAAQSSLEELARDRASSIYLPGNIRHMLPAAVACDTGSLRPGEVRPALVCELEIDRDGQSLNHRWHTAMVRVEQRMSYGELNSVLESGSAGGGLDSLAAAASALRSWRHSNQLVMPDRPDYTLQLDRNGRLADIVRSDKTAAHGIVEECMIAANQCAAATLDGGPGIYVTHGGFRPERLGDVRALVQRELPELAEVDPASLEGYVGIMRAAASATSELPLRTVLSRWLQRAGLSCAPAPHFGMGLPCYTTVTSPLRKYNDLLMHRVLAGQRSGASEAALPGQATLDHILSVWDRARRARQLAEQWLKADWLAVRHTANPDRVWEAEICQINSRGANVRLVENGIEGMLDLSASGRKFRFDAKLLELDGGEQRLRLDQRLRVRIGAVDTERHTVSFAPLDGATSG